MTASASFLAFDTNLYRGPGFGVLVSILHNIWEAPAKHDAEEDAQHTQHERGASRRSGRKRDKKKGDSTHK